MSHACAADGCTKIGVKKCAKCHVVHYCGKVCQKADWKSHKTKCAQLAMAPGGSVFKDLDPAGVYVDPGSGRSFTFGGRMFDEGSGSASSQQGLEMLRAMAGLDTAVGAQIHEVDRGSRHRGRGRLAKHEPPQRFDLGDEVDVAVDGRSTIPPYKKGWARGVVVKKHAYDEGGASYLVKLHDGGEVVPGHRDDPDFVRGVAVSDSAADAPPTRFAAGDEVECQVGPNEWHRGVVRATCTPIPGWGRGWTADGEHDTRHVGPKDVVAYLVTPRGKTYSASDPMSTITVPADKDCFVRRWHPGGGGGGDDDVGGELVVSRTSQLSICDE